MPPSATHAPRDCRHVALARVAVGLERARSLRLDCGSVQLLGRIPRGHLAGDALAGPPFLVENPQLQTMLPGGLQADAHVAEPVRTEPVVMRTRLRGEGAVAALGHFVDVHLQPLFALVAMQPEERAGELPRFERQFPEFLFDLPDVRLASRQGGQMRECQRQNRRKQAAMGGGDCSGPSHFRVLSFALMVGEFIFEPRSIVGIRPGRRFAN